MVGAAQTDLGVRMAATEVSEIVEIENVWIVMSDGGKIAWEA